MIGENTHIYILFSLMIKNIVTKTVYQVTKIMNIFIISKE